MTIKILTIVGARPQFIKAATVSRAIRNHFSAELKESILHTGQHFDANMSDIFFEELNIPAPEFNLEISGGTHGAMTGKMLEGIEKIMLEKKPNWVLIYGDTNSTLAGALAAAKLHIPIAHVEAGLRSFNRKMPEEINRIVADSVSTLLLCPTKTAVKNLKNEGQTNGVYNVGDVMYDAALYSKNIAEQHSTILQKLNVTPRNYILSTCHRAENTDNLTRLTDILTSLNAISKHMPVILPLHPRTRKIIHELNAPHLTNHIRFIDPVSYNDMVALEMNAALIATDSGGVQKEAYFYKVPCVTLRDETEWVETISAGWNRLAPPATANIKAEIEAGLNSKPENHPKSYGNGHSAEEICKRIIKHS